MAGADDSPPPPHWEGLRYPSRIGALVRGRRDALGMTQTDLANALGWTQSQVSRIETGGPDRPVPPPDMLNPLAEVLQMPVSELLASAGYAVETPKVDVDAAETITPELIVEMITRAQGIAPGAQRAIQEILNLGRKPARPQQEATK